MGQIIEKSAEHAERMLVDHLLSGALAIMPCDTIYGIVGIVPDSEHALRHVKGRPDTKPFIQLVSLGMVEKIAREPIDTAILACWPGPLTVIVADVAGGKTAIRVPSDPFLTQVLQKLGRPMYSTSVNVSEEPSLTVFDEMVARFGEVVPLFIKGSEDQGTVPSTIIDITTEPWTLVRQGVLDVTSLHHRMNLM